MESHIDWQKALAGQNLLHEIINPTGRKTLASYPRTTLHRTAETTSPKDRSDARNSDRKNGKNKGVIEKCKMKQKQKERR